MRVERWEVDCKLLEQREGMPRVGVDGEEYTPLLSFCKLTYEPVNRYKDCAPCRHNEWAEMAGRDNV